MPQALEDLRKLSPERTEVDDELVQRWNRVAEVWKGNPDFREAVLRYATRRAHRDPASVDALAGSGLPLDRTSPLAAQDAVSRRGGLGRRGREPAPARPRCQDGQGPAIRPCPNRSSPSSTSLSRSLSKLPRLVEILDEEAPSQQSATFTSGIRAESFHDIEVESTEETRPDPAQSSSTRSGTPWASCAPSGKRRWPSCALGRLARASAGLPIGPYRLAAVASIRARSAGQVVLQGMPNKQVEMLVPSFTGGGSSSRIVLAVWLYENQSLVITYTRQPVKPARHLLGRRHEPAAQLRRGRQAQSRPLSARHGSARPARPRADQAVQARRHHRPSSVNWLRWFTARSCAHQRSDTGRRFPRPALARGSRSRSLGPCRTRSLALARRRLLAAIARNRWGRATARRSRRNTTSAPLLKPCAERRGMVRAACRPDRFNLLADAWVLLTLLADIRP